MGQVLIRSIDDAMLDRIRARARRNHRSMEAELRSIIEAEGRGDAGRASEQAPAYGVDEAEEPSSAIRYPDPDAPPFSEYDPIPVEGNSVSDLLQRDRRAR